MRGSLFFYGLIISSVFPNSTSGQTEQGVLSPNRIVLLVPDRLKGFYPDGESIGKVITLGTLQYSLCEKRFVLKDQRIKILLFDFVQAEIMYAQATKNWSNQVLILSDSAIGRPVVRENCSGWESYSKSSNTAQVFLGICDRYFLTITGENANLETLKSMLDQFSFDKFPRK